MSALRDFLAAEIEALRQIQKRHSCYNGWLSTAHFVLEHGTEFAAVTTDLPDGVRLGRPKLCFENAGNLALDTQRYIYCEGYALSMIPVEHAWCIDEQGHVVDPTWGNGRLPAREYFGLAFNTEYLRHHVLTHRYWGLIDAWRADWPLLKARVCDWRHPIMDPLTNHNLTHEPETCPTH